MGEAARNEWALDAPLVDRLRDHAVIERLDVTPFRQECQLHDCSSESHRERVIGQEHPYLFTCAEGHAVSTPARYRD